MSTVWPWGRQWCQLGVMVCESGGEEHLAAEATHAGHRDIPPATARRGGHIAVVPRGRQVIAVAVRDVVAALQLVGPALSSAHRCALFGSSAPPTEIPSPPHCALESQEEEHVSTIQDAKKDLGA
jgi:hypothetical protein